MKQNETYISNVTVKTEPVIVTKYVHEGTALNKDGKALGKVRFEVHNGKFLYVDETGNDYEGEVVDYNKTEIEGFDYGLNVEGVEVDDDVDSWDLRWYDYRGHSTGSLNVKYSPVYKILLVSKY